MTIKSKEITSKKSTNGKAPGKEVKLPTVEQIQAALDKNIENFRAKNDLIRNRTKFLKTKEDLQEFIADQGSDYDLIFEGLAPLFLFGI